MCVRGRADAIAPAPDTMRRRRRVYYHMTWRGLIEFELAYLFRDREIAASLKCLRFEQDSLFGSNFFPRHVTF